MIDVDATRLRLLADEVESAVSAVPGVVRIQGRPGVGRLAKRLFTGLSAGPGAPAQSEILLDVTPAATLAVLDLVVDGAYSAPVVVREVASAIGVLVGLEGLPLASVDVRVVAVT
ncbi:hypothetical protein AX769_02625 [Frondihabitans sp. PAMC 28766]|uniref:hypothetical protein n=1 Tax=Frondihabitans sp. PAMC 28766 TaxID=1795630 RepID=UPI00078CDAE0|nr:hypothetical protein [Frondihabitans sp. PAMC 28766]AMM19229.1 hypothetical protein AX769_02625 [Frondihabitans sp. PAMC 28766]